MDNSTGKKILISKELTVRKETGKKIREARLKKGMNQLELAHAMFYKTQQEVSQLELGKKEITIGRLYTIASILDTNVLDLLPSEVEEKNSHS